MMLTKQLLHFLKRNWLAAVGLILIIFGVCVGWQPFTDNTYNKQPAGIAFNVPANLPKTPASGSSQTIISGHPMRLQIPSLGFDLQIIDGIYNNKSQTWNLTTNEVQYATVTPEPNNSNGNTFMYGHNRREVFEFLYKIQPGAQAVVTTDNNHVFTYAYVGAHTTDPNDDSLFKYQGPPILTLQTCSGVMYQYRQLFTFSLVSAH